MALPNRFRPEIVACRWNAVGCGSNTVTSLRRQHADLQDECPIQGAEIGSWRPGLAGNMAKIELPEGWAGVADPLRALMAEIERESTCTDHRTSPRSSRSSNYL